MRGRVAARLLLALLLGLALFTILASLIFLIGTGLFWRFQHPFFQWWLYLFEARGNPAVRAWLIVSGLAGAAGPVLLGGGWLIRRLILGRAVRGWSLRRDQPAAKPVVGPIRSPTDNHGHARWMTFEEAHDLWPGPARGYGGIVVGEAYAVHEDSTATGRFRPRDPKTWGQGGQAPLLIDPCEHGSTHSLIIAGSGAYKTVSAVSTLLSWTGSAVVLDPSTELAPMLRADRERMGHKVFELNPRTATTTGFNVLDWIDIASPMAEIDVRAVVEWVCGDRGPDDKADFFRSRGKALVTCLLADLLWDDKLGPDQKTLRTLRARVSVPEPAMRGVLEAIHTGSNNLMARDMAGALKDLVAETFSGIYANADEATAWLASATFADLVSGNAFHSRDLITGRTTVFVGIPLKALDSAPAVARVIIGALLNAAYEADGAIEGRVLYLLDEVFRLGPMAVINTARDAGRKYGITLHLIYQSVGQIIQQWGPEGKRAWYDTVSWRAYAAVKDEETAKELAATIGEYGVLAWSEGHNSGTHGKGLEFGSRSKGETRNYHETRRQLARPEELMHDAREDEQFVIPKGGRPLRCGRAVYFRRPEFLRRVNESRFAGTEVSTKSLNKVRTS